MLDGPFPEHYEPMEAPIPNPLHPNQSESPVAFLYDKAAGRDKPFGTVKDYPYVATSYRLTEHEHFVTQHERPDEYCAVLEPQDDRADVGVRCPRAVGELHLGRDPVALRT